VRLLIAAAAGVLFGTVTSLVNNVPGMLGEVGQAHSEDSAATWTAIFVSQILDSGWAWAALAFGAGLLIATRPARAAIAGAVALIGATIAYYATDLLFGIEAYGPVVGFWAVRAVAFGLPLGAAGALARRPGPVGLLAGLVIPVGAAANMLLFPVYRGLNGESSANRWAQTSVWVAAAVGVALVAFRFVRRRSRTPVPG